MGFAFRLTANWPVSVFSFVVAGVFGAYFVPWLGVLEFRVYDEYTRHTTHFIQ